MAAWGEGGRGSHPSLAPQALALTLDRSQEMPDKLWVTEGAGPFSTPSFLKFPHLRNPFAVLQAPE